MKIILASAWYLPDSVGGTEIYTHELAKYLINHGHTVQVFTPRFDLEMNENDTVENVSIVRYSVSKNPEKNVISGSKPEEHLTDFIDKVKEFNPDIYHQQTLTWACGKHHLKAVKESGFKTVLTAHIPGIVCLNNEMLLKGKTVCSGIISENPCFECHLHVRKKIPVSISFLLNKISMFLPDSVKENKPLLNVLHEKKDELLYVNKYSNKIIAVCQWLFDSLKQNGIDDKKLLLSRQGVDLNKYKMNHERIINDEKLKLLFVGRITHVKGVHNLIRAVQKVNPDLVELVIVGKAITEDYDYELFWKKESAEFPNIVWKGRLNPEEINREFERADILCVPSIWLETGPLVVYEANAKGLPVLGSDLGGISELVQHEKNGYLVKPGNVEELTKAIFKFTDRNYLKIINKNVKLPRSTEAVGQDMEKVYLSLNDNF